MAAYRVFEVDSNGHVVKAARIIDCKDDEAAAAEARVFIDGYDIEIWDGARRVAKIESATKAKKASGRSGN